MKTNNTNKDDIEMKLGWFCLMDEELKLKHIYRKLLEMENKLK